MSGMKEIFDPTSRVLGSSINMRNIRHDVIATNIANAETPGYKAKIVDFEDALERAVQLESMRGAESKDPEHYAIGGAGSISRTRADIYDNPDINTSNDMNSVDMETEIANMKENTIIYNAAIQLMNKKLGALRYAATEGGR